MSAENAPKKPGFLYWVGIAIMLVLLLILCMVPFAVMGIALKRSGVFNLGHSAISDRKGQNQPQPDLSALRVVAEKAASNILPEPQTAPLNSSLQELKITVPGGDLQKARGEVLELLKKSHQQYLESGDQNEIHLIVTMQESEWKRLSAGLREDAVKDGFSATSPTVEMVDGGSSEVVAEIVIRH